MVVVPSTKSEELSLAMKASRSDDQSGKPLPDFLCDLRISHLVSGFKGENAFAKLRPFETCSKLFFCHPRAKEENRFSPPPKVSITSS